MSHRMKTSATDRDRTRTAHTDTSTDTDEGYACPECNTNNVQENSDGEVICQECSLVVSENNLDRGPEWRAFSSKEKQSKSRVGSPVTERQHDKGLTTDIGWQNKDRYGNKLSGRKRKQMNRLRTQQKYAKTKDAKERNLRQAFTEIERMASALGVPKSVREIACMIYRQAMEADLIRGRSIEGIASSSLYAGCRKASIPRSLSDIATVSRVDELEISRAYRYILGELTLEIEPVSPKEHVPRFCSELDASNEVEQMATEVIDVTAETGLASGKSPTGFAAAAIYTAVQRCNADLTQVEVADVANVSVVTIRNRYQEQMKIMNDRAYSA